jgi:alpha-glucosidase
MYFNKCHQPENFAFPSVKDCTSTAWKIGGQTFRRGWAHLGEDVYRLNVTHRRWPEQLSRAELDLDFNGPTGAACDMHPVEGLSLRDTRGGTLLASEPGRVFGVAGQAWLMQFAWDRSMRFYGMGEKSSGFEHSGKHTKFWNTDVWADFDNHGVIHGSPDPMYLSVPYLIVKRGNRYVGVLINNPHAVFMSINPRVRIAAQADADRNGARSRFYIGAPDGVPELYFIVGPTLRELTRKLQRLVGRTPLPPIWALGHHQSRWGYASHRDLDRVEKTFRKHRIPNDGLWLDIDYMRGFRVFTWDKQHWPKLRDQIDDLQARGQHVVPILDPGVKADKAFGVYKSGLKADIFCHNTAGTNFVGFVWPGTTVFPDFSMAEGRDWWARWVKRDVAKLGITGVWIDMNDPSTGSSENSEMLFGRGKLPHDTYHNQYALGMAKATHEAFRQTHPDRRPFVLTRSGYTSINRYAAAWTGDNFANAHHLRNSIPTSLNLALSGLPFNGPDVCGFGGDATGELAIAWYKAGFLFPFMRNHASHGTRNQEPWAFGSRTMRIIRRYIRLRYKLLPYLYNLFAEQEQSGEAILRPLFYDFVDSRKLPLDQIDDQFMIGPAIMQAPVLDPDAHERWIVLPAGMWFDVSSGRWITGGRRIKARTTDATTPLFIRDGSVIPMRVGEPTDNRTDLRDIELHLFISPSFRGAAAYTHHADDGESYRYQQGGRTSVSFDVRRKKAGLTVRLNEEASGYGSLGIHFVTYGRDNRVILHHDQTEHDLTAAPHRWRFVGEAIDSHRTHEVRVTDA